MSKTKQQLIEENTAMKTTIDELIAENTRFRDNATEELLRQSKLVRAEYNMIEGGEVVVASPAIGIWAEWIKQDFERAGGINFVEQCFSFQKAGGPQFMVTIVKRPEGKTPAQIINDLKAEIERLKQRGAKKIRGANRSKVKQ